MDGGGGKYDHLADLSHDFERTLPQVVPGRVLHIDGDFLPYQCAGNDDVPFAIARRNMFARIENTKLRAGAERAVVHITGPLSDKGKRFELAVSQPYQGQRTHSQRPKNWDALRELLMQKCIDSHDYVQWDDREADDALTQAQWEAQATAEDSHLSVITSNDKDLRQVAGLYLDWTTNELKQREHTHYYQEYLNDPDGFQLPSTIREGALFEGVWFLLWQMLVGDKTDNIPGIKAASGPWLLGVLPDVLSRKAQEGKEVPKDKPLGPALAAQLLATVPPTKPSLAYELVKEIYRDTQGENWQEYFKEQWHLLCLFYTPDDDRLQLARDIRDGKFDR